MDVPLFVVRIVGGVAIIRILRTGSASVDGEGFRRDDDPFSFWTILLVGVALIGLLFFSFTL